MVFVGEDGILSEEALENCVALPMMAIFGTETSTSLWSKAATLLHCIANRHPLDIKPESLAYWIEIHSESI